MKTNIVVSDLVKNRFISSMVIVFIATASTLVALASILTINLAGSIDSFMVRSQTPHFLQMHSGSYDSARMQQFAKNNDKIEKFQTIEFVNIANSELTLGGNILSGSMQDNGIVMQSPEFDFLLDLDGEIIHPKKR